MGRGGKKFKIKLIKNVNTKSIEFPYSTLQDASLQVMF
jgi:hypothetical protein